MPWAHIVLDKPKLHARLRVLDHAEHHDFLEALVHVPSGYGEDVDHVPP